LSAGARVVCQLRRFVRPLDPLRLGGPMTRLAPLGRWLRPRKVRARLEPAAPNDERVRPIWDAAASDLAILAVRDPAYYAWRFGCCPSGRQRPYVIVEGKQPIGVCALERRSGRTNVLDLLAPKRDFGRAIDAVMSFCCDDAAVEMRLNERGPLAR